MPHSQFSMVGKGLALVALSVLIALIVGRYLISVTSPLIGTFHDDSIYVTSARAMAEGSGYLLESLPTEPPQTKYPILFPALLALVWKLVPHFPDNIPLLKSVALLGTVVWFIASAVLLKREGFSRMQTAMSIFVISSFPWIIYISTNALSESWFAAFSTGAILLGRKCEDKAEIKYAVLAAVFASAAYHTRSIGICLLPAIFLALLVRKQFRHAVLFLSSFLLFAAPWLYWQYANRDIQEDYYSYRNYYSSFHIFGDYTALERCRIISMNIMIILLYPWRFLPAPLAVVLTMLSGPFAIWGLVRSRVSLSLRFYLVFSLLIVVSWVWQPIRFLLPILPAIFIILFAGLPKAARPCFWVALLPVFLNSIRVDANEAVQIMARGMLLSETKEWIPFQREMEWIRNNLPEDSIVQSYLDSTVFLYSNRKAVRGFSGNIMNSFYLGKERPLGTVDEFQAELLKNKVTHIAVVPWASFPESSFLSILVSELREKYPWMLVPVFRDENSDFVVYQLNARNSEESYLLP